MEKVEKCAQDVIGAAFYRDFVGAMLVLKDTYGDMIGELRYNGLYVNIDLVEKLHELIGIDVGKYRYELGYFVDVIEIRIAESQSNEVHLDVGHCVGVVFNTVQEVDEDVFEKIHLYVRDVMGLQLVDDRLMMNSEYVKKFEEVLGKKSVDGVFDWDDVMKNGS